MSTAGLSPISLPAVRHGDKGSIKDSPTENSEERSSNCHLIAMTWKSSKENWQNLVSSQICETELKYCFNPQSLLQHIQDTHTRFKMGSKMKIFYFFRAMCLWNVYSTLNMLLPRGVHFSPEFWAMDLNLNEQRIYLTINMLVLAWSIAFIIFLLN